MVTRASRHRRLPSAFLFTLAGVAASSASTLLVRTGGYSEVEVRDLLAGVAFLGLLAGLVLAGRCEEERERDLSQLERSTTLKSEERLEQSSLIDANLRGRARRAWMVCIVSVVAAAVLLLRSTPDDASSGGSRSEPVVVGPVSGRPMEIRT